MPKDKEIHKLKLELTSTKSDLADAKTRIKELEDENDEKDDSAGSSGKPEKNSSNSSVPPSQESIAARELRRTKSLRKPSGKPSGGQPEHKGSTLQSVSTPDRIIKHEPAYCKCRISQRTRRKAGLVSKVYPSASARHRPQTKQNYHAEKDKGAENQDENLLGESLPHFDEEFERFKKGILKVKQKVSRCFRTDEGDDDLPSYIP